MALFLCTVCIFFFSFVTLKNYLLPPWSLCFMSKQTKTPCLTCAEMPIAVQNFRNQTSVLMS